MSRFDGLAEPEREALQAASVLGGSFDGVFLARLLGGFRAPAAVQTSLEELCRRGFLVREESRGSTATFDVAHHLTRQLVAENLLHAQRRLLHRRAAEAMESLFVDRLDEQARALAWHYEMAGVPARAVDYLLRAIRRAGALAAAQVVVDLCRRALALASEGDVVGEPVREIHERLADALAILARYAEALEHYDHAHCSDAPLLAQAVRERKRATVLEKTGRYDDAVAGFERALDHLKSAMDLPEAARVFLGLGRVYCRRGECGTAIDMSLIALEMAEQEGDDWGVALACNTLGVIHTMAGDLPAALDVLRRAEGILRAKKERFDLSATLTNLGWVYHKLEKSGEAVEHLRRSIQLCEVTGNRHGLATASDLLSQVLVARGERREADRYLRKAVKIFAGGGGGEHAMMPELWGQMGAW
jgi:tetratricopeptide (TPR) repeat protein